MEAPRALLALALIVPALSGCIATGGGADLFSAWDAEAIARPAAEDWNENATVAFARTEEVSNITIDETNTTFVDDELGDGRSIAWRLVYTAPSVNETAYVVIVLSNGTIAEAFEADLKEETNAPGVSVSYEERFWPARNWTIDSTLAAAIASSNATWQQAEENASKDGYTIPEVDWVMIGAPQGEDPLWFAELEVDDPTGNETDEAELWINATTGQILDGPPAWVANRTSSDVDVGGGAYGGGLSAESGTYSGTLSINAPTAEHTFEIDQTGHPTLEVDLSPDPPGQSASVYAILEDPSGERFHTNASVTTGSAELFGIGNPRAGAYTLTLELTQGAALRYSGCWVAEGSGPDYTSPPGTSGCGDFMG